MQESWINAVLRVVADMPDVVLVGGQAIVLWCEYYKDSPALSLFDQSVTTQDLDFLGSKNRALQVAEEMNAQLDLPTIDHVTPSTAVLDLGGQNDDKDRVDFLNYVLGPGDRVSEGAVKIEVAVASERLTVQIMHPLHCFQSKLENRLTLGRSHSTAQAQLEATTLILIAFISEMLGDETEPPDKARQKNAYRTLDGLAAYLERDIAGSKAHRVMQRDPMLVLEQFAEEVRIPAKFREYNIRIPMDRIKAKRSRRDSRSAT